MDRKKTAILLAILLLPVAVVLGLRLFRDYYQPKPPGLTVDRQIELLREKSTALGFLDNADYDAAMNGLETIVRELPNEPLGHRNLALALFKPSPLSADSQLAITETARLQRLFDVVEKVLQLEANQASAQALAGRVYAKHAELLRAGDRVRMEEARARAKKCFEESARLALDDPAPLYDLYLLEKDFGDPEDISLDGLKALQGARRRAPENTACLAELLRVLMLKRNPESRIVVEQLLRQMPHDVDESFPNVRPRQGLEEIAKALAAKPTEPAPRLFEILNLTASNLQKSFGFYQRDIARLRPHPLEFVLEDFTPSFYANLPVDAEPPIAVKFVEGTPSGMEKAAGLAAAQREDLILDNAWGTVLVRVKQVKTSVEVLSENPRAAIEPIEIAGEFPHLLLVDLDIDIKAPLPSNPKENIPADLDLILHGDAGVRLLENREEGGKRRWIDRTADCNLPALAGVRWLLSCDVDHDGNLDLVAGLTRGMKVLRNRGAWAFEDITSRSQGAEKLDTVAAAHGDFDRDGDLDLIVAQSDGQIVVLDNRRGGRFEPRQLDVRCERARSLLVLDANDDGRLDCIVGYAQGGALLRGNQKGLSAPDADLYALPAGETNLALSFDYDNDGWTDVVLAGKPGAATTLWLFRNVQGKHFEPKPELLPKNLPNLLSLQTTDLHTEDGDLDLLFIKGGALTALQNEGGQQNHWLKLRLRAELNVDAAGQGQATKSNYRCIGGLAEIRAGRHYQLQQVAGTVTHFGLGQRTRVDTVRAIWTNGVPQSIIKPKVNAVLAETQRVKGSCPYLYTWDGEKFVFVTDCLWSSGLGMKQTHGVDMPHDRQFNYLVIPGDKLRPKDGRYVLQFTNELWEGPFLDQAQLWVVDHPIDVEIFTNQRVPPDAKEEFKLLTVKKRHYPRAARDHLGRDVLDRLSRRDNRLVGGFRRNRYVGVTEPHWLELDLGDLSNAKAATLFLTGWIWPTDNTANIAISLDPRFAGPAGVIGGAQPPTLQVPDGKGGWTTVNPMTGFPSGKMQTVAIPIPLDKLPAGDHRIRLATMMELYWDEAFLAIDEPLAPHEVKKLRVAEADLHYRGYCRIVQDSPESPFVYEYSDVDPAPRWLPLPGKYTRYGSVTELLHEPDCCYVAMSPGDEVTLQFHALPPPRTGWTRSFILFANGWLKDYDLNASAGDAAGPYPFDGMSRYPPSSHEVHPNPKFIQEYLNRNDDGARFWEWLSRQR